MASLVVVLVIGDDYLLVQTLSGL